MQQFLMIGLAVLLFLLVCRWLVRGEMMGGFINDINREASPLAYWANICLAVAAEALLVWRIVDQQALDRLLHW